MRVIRNGEQIYPPKGESKGLECPRCGCRHFLTTMTRPKEDEIVRIRVCRNCGYKKHSVERWQY